MEALRITKGVEKDGELSLNDLPFKKGQQVEIIFLTERDIISNKKVLTSKELLQSGLIGLWKDRTDIGDTVQFARKLREDAQNRWV